MRGQGDKEKEKSLWAADVPNFFAVTELCQVWKISPATWSWLLKGKRGPERCHSGFRVLILGLWFQQVTLTFLCLHFLPKNNKSLTVVSSFKWHINDGKAG